MTAAATTRSSAPLVAVLYSGDSADPHSWSGTPYGLTTAIERLGVRLARIDTTPPRQMLRIARRLPMGDPELLRLRSPLAQRRLDAGGPYDAVIQIGSDFAVRTSVPTATYDDMTVAQHEALRDAWFASYPQSARSAWRERQRRGYLNATVCTTMSRWAADSIVADYGIPPDRTRVVGLGANTVIEPPADRDWSVPRYLLVGVDWRRKNVPATIAAFAKVRERIPDATLDIVSSYDGPAGPGVTLHGLLTLGDDAQRRTLEGLFRSATCFVMPSAHEAAGIVYAEAGFAGVPSIGTTVGGAPELVGPGGVVVEPGRPDALVDAMLRLADPATARELGAAAASHARGFTWDATAQRMLGALGLAG